MAWLMMFDLPVPTANNRFVNTGARDRASLARRAKYRKLRDAWQSYAIAKIRELSIPPATSQRVLELTRVYAKGQRAIDADGLVGGLKPVLDAFVRAGLVKDDSPKWLSVSYDQRKAGASEKGGLFVRMRDIAECVAIPDASAVGAETIDIARTPTSHLVIGLIELAHVNALGKPDLKHFKDPRDRTMARLICDEIDRRVPARLA